MKMRNSLILVIISIGICLILGCWSNTPSFTEVDDKIDQYFQKYQNSRNIDEAELILKQLIKYISKPSIRKVPGFYYNRLEMLATSRLYLISLEKKDEKEARKYKEETDKLLLEIYKNKALLAKYRFNLMKFVLRLDANANVKWVKDSTKARQIFDQDGSDEVTLGAVLLKPQSKKTTGSATQVKQDK
jgi:hypothetical protein